ncbi:MAG: SDR family NAD(P)-dependent oxidoreductase [Shewanella sp.]|nr:SDR family NAD(P)-dependent oxidoreductase [Shewanella sp.]MCF1429882.1 SDR family NAD(P)-dependent oxidoreductase [Shewanella sp.]MCF1457795.1 SDR family NAD(P)-dependent oxidoreductase [Shewanella sp.]
MSFAAKSGSSPTGRVLITGASSGIGAQLASDYLSQGWQVFACGRSHQRLVPLAGSIPLVFDVTVREGVQSAARRLTQLLQGQKLDLLILNAGDCEYIDDPLYFDDRLFERIISTNLLSVGYCLNSFLPLLSPHGRLALMSSSATYLPLPRAEAYGASKAALNYLAKTLAISLASHPQSRGTGVTLICPGFVRTPLTARNDFPMPMSVDVVWASRQIRQGLARGYREIHFPKKFTLLLKLLGCLPAAWWQALMVRLSARQAVSAPQASQDKDVTP